MRKPQAKRKLRALLEEMGLNSDSHLERTDVGTRTFGSEAAWWKGNKLPIFKPSCQETMGSHLEKYLLHRFRSLAITAIDERRVQEFIVDLTRTEYKWPNGVSKQLSPKTIRNIVGVLKLMLEKKSGANGSFLFPKEQRYLSADEMRQVVGFATGQRKALFARLAGTGLRCGEAFGLHIEDLDLLSAKICVRRSIWNGKEVSVKSKKGYRVVDIEPSLVKMLTVHLGNRRGGRVFQTRHGTPFCKSNVRRKLNQILKKLDLAAAGLHAFRHGRVSMLQENGVPTDLIKEWVGHSNLQTTLRYTHFRDDFRKQIVCDVALFSQPNMAEKLPFSPNGPNFTPVADVTAVS